MKKIFNIRKNSYIFVFKIKYEKIEKINENNNNILSDKLFNIYNFLNKRYDLKAKTVNIDLQFLTDDFANNKISLIIEFII